MQPQTRVLMRTLRRLRIPTLIFLNKVDRAGADPERVVRAVAEKLTSTVVAMGSVAAPGTRSARCTPYGPADVAFIDRLLDLLAGQDDVLLADWVADASSLPYSRLRRELAARTGRALVQPVFAGSAMTGAGVDALIAGITELLPTVQGDVDAPVSGTVFAIERGPAGRRSPWSGSSPARSRSVTGSASAPPTQRWSRRYESSRTGPMPWRRRSAPVT